MTRALDLRPVLDFVASCDPASSEGGSIHHVRSLLARQIVLFAAQCRNTHELLDGLQVAFDPAYGLAPLQLRGTGSTRRVWDAPFDLVIKTVRTDPEPRWEHNPAYLALRRSVATFTEFAFSAHCPFITARLYGVLFAFGKSPHHPPVCVSEKVRPLYGDRDLYCEFQDLFISAQTGRLLARGLHFDTKSELHPKDLCLTQVLTPDSSGEDSVFTENLGFDSEGNVVFLDCGNYQPDNLRQDNETLMPVGLDRIGYTLPASSVHSTQRDLDISLRAQSFYEDFRRRLQERFTLPSGFLDFPHSAKIESAEIC